MRQIDFNLIPDTAEDFRDSIDAPKPLNAETPKRFPKRGFRLSKTALMWLLMEISFSNASGKYLAQKFGITEGMVSRYKSRLRKEWDNRQQYLVLYRKDGALFF